MADLNALRLDASANLYVCLRFLGHPEFEVSAFFFNMRSNKYPQTLALRHQNPKPVKP